MTNLGTKISIITLNGNGLNIPIKRQTLIALIYKNYDSSIWCS